MRPNMSSEYVVSCKVYGDFTATENSLNFENYFNFARF